MIRNIKLKSGLHAVMSAHVGLLGAIFLSGCSLQQIPVNSIATPQSVGLQGMVHGGRQPVAGASIYLFAAGTTGYPGQAGATPASLLNSVSGVTNADSDGNYYVQTDSNGGFGISGDYSASCQSGNSLVYVVSVSGNPGNGGVPPVGNNSAIMLAALLGPCQGISSSTYVTVNEATTVAAAYALAGYSVTPTHGAAISNTVVTAGFSAGTSVGAGSAYQGLTKAFSAAGNLVNSQTGTAYATTPAQNSHGVVPQSELNSLANILASCVNSTGPASSSCVALFTATTVGGVSPTNTFQAAINIAQNPGQASITNSTTGIFPLSTSTVPFQPSLATAPTDWTIAVQYTDASLSAPFGLAIDASGDVWVSNSAGVNLTEFDTLGSVLSTPTTGYIGGGLNKPFGIGVDPSGNIWASNTASQILSEFTSSGAPISGVGFANASSSNVVVPDANGNIWTTGSYRDYLYENLADGSIPGNIPISNGGLAYAKSSYGAAIDQLGNVWTSNEMVNSLSKFSVANGAALSPAPAGYIGGGLSSPYGIAIDGNNNVWAANIGASVLSEMSNTGTALSGTGFAGGGLSSARYLAIDGLNRIWASNATAVGQVSQFSNAGTPITPSTGYRGGGMNQPRGIAVDGSGNVWVANFANNSVTEIIGAAAPTVTPLSLAAKNSKVGTRP